MLDRELFIREAADAAGLLGYYDSHYRTYCRFTHGALRAMGDFLNELTDPEDNRTMALSAFMTLEVLVSIGAESPNLESLFERLGRLAPPPTDTNPTLAD